MNPIRLIFPERCRACGKTLRFRQEALCATCRDAYESDKKRICATCRRAHPLCRCAPDIVSPAIAEYASLFRYRKNRPGGALLFAVKDRKDRAALKLLAGDLAKLIRRRYAGRDDLFITWLPRGRDAMIKKGSDQAKELARRTAKILGLPAFGTLKRKGVYRKKQKESDLCERARNAADAYLFCGSRAKIAGKRAILIDDICTTGASGASGAGILAENGVRDVVFVTAGRS